VPNIQTTTHYYSSGHIELQDGQFRDELLVFAAADTFLKGTILARVTASGKLTPFVVGGTGGAETPRCVLTYDVVRTTAGDEPIRALVKGEVNKNRLIIDADGNGNNITAAILDQLRDYGITPVDVQVLASQV
jgi:hypothetical protein